jgi:hypothetical protein
MFKWGQYAIIDVGDGSQSQGKILLLLDDKRAALEIASELRTRGLDVSIELRAPGQKPTLISDPASKTKRATISRLPLPVAGV